MLRVATHRPPGTATFRVNIAGCCTPGVGNPGHGWTTLDAAAVVSLLAGKSWWNLAASSSALKSPRRRVEYVPVKRRGELDAVVRLNHLDRERQLGQHVVDELDGGLLIELGIDPLGDTPVTTAFR